MLLAQVGHDLRSTLETYRDVGNTEEVLRMVREYKAGSLAMQPQQRRHMVGSCFFKDKQVSPPCLRRCSPLCCAFVTAARVRVLPVKRRTLRLLCNRVYATTLTNDCVVPQRGTQVINATWMVDGAVFRKWVSAGTYDYGSEAFSLSSYVPPRLYTQVRPRCVLDAFDRSTFSQSVFCRLVAPPG